MVRRMPKVGNLVFVAYGCGVVIPNGFCSGHFVYKRSGKINEINATMGSGETGGVGMAMLDNIHIRRMGEDVIM